MKTILALVPLLAACTTSSDTRPDASTLPDGAIVNPGNEYWDCYFWPGTVNKCAPKCANATLLGREVFGTGNTCEYLAGVKCPTEQMTAYAGDSGAGCCVYSEQPFQRVDFVRCLE